MNTSRELHHVFSVGHGHRFFGVFILATNRDHGIVVLCPFTLGNQLDVGALAMASRSASGNGMRASDTRALLRRRGFVAKKSMGQNFVVDDALLRRVVHEMRVVGDASVLEIGPGTGNLTRHLLEAGARVLAVEKDDRLVASLAEDFASDVSEGRLELVHADVLRWLADGDVQVSSHARGRCRVVANLPYNVTSDVLKRILPRGDVFEDLHLMLQDEAGRRLVQARPGDKDYRAMSVRVDYYCSRADYLFRVGREKYFPQPHVDSCVVAMALRTPEERLPLCDGNVQAYFSMVQRAFLARRKALRNALAPTYASTDVAAAVAELAWPADVRPQSLSSADYVHLYNRLGGARR